MGSHLWKKFGQRKGQFRINVYRCFVSLLIWRRLEHDFKLRKDKRERKRIKIEKLNNLEGYLMELSPIGGRRGRTGP